MRQRYAPIPAVVWLLFVLIIALHGVAYPLDFWSRWAWFDDLMHLLTPFAVTLVIAFYLYSRDLLGAEHRTIPLVLVLTAVGLALGFLWESLEWGTRYLLGKPQEPPLDTAADLVLDLIGILYAALIATWVTR